MKQSNRRPEDDYGATFLHSLQNPNQHLMCWCLFLQVHSLDIHTIKEGRMWWQMLCPGFNTDIVALL